MNVVARCAAIAASAVVAAVGCSEPNETKTADLDAGGAVATTTATTSSGSGGAGGATSAGGSGGAGGWAVPPDETIAGKDRGEWSESWYQWLYGLPGGPTHPMNGGPCEAGQSGEVFHLVGTRTGKTTCPVPNDKHLFAMIGHVAVITDPEHDGCSTPVDEADMKAQAEAGKPYITERSAMLDGVPLEDVDAYWTVSGKFSWKSGDPPLFPWSAPVGPNDCGIPEGDRTGLAFGYWVMIRPLAPGKHVLRVHSLMEPGPGAKMPWDAEIELVVAD